MTLAHPLTEIGEQLEKAFAAIESMPLPEHLGPVNLDDDASHTWFPNLEIDDTPEEYVVSVELRGLDPDELSLEVQGESLVLATRHALDSDEEAALLDTDEAAYDSTASDEANPTEEDFGLCVCDIALPANVDRDRVLALCEDGLLKVTLPKPTR